MLISFAISSMYKPRIHVRLVEKQSEYSKLSGKDLREDNQMIFAYDIMK